MVIIKAKLEQLINGNSVREVEKVTADVVKQACSKMKFGKTDVTEAFSSDILLHCPDILFEFLAAVFRSFHSHGKVTMQVFSCAFLPIFNGGLKSPDKFDSYRAIAGQHIYIW